MSIEPTGQQSTAFWVLGAAALMWNLLGMFIYYGQVTMSPEALRKMTEIQQEFFLTTPTWATAAFAVAVTAGVLGSVLLLLRKAVALPVFIVSLLAILVQNTHAFLVSNGWEVFGASGLILPVAILTVAVLLVFYARAQKANGTLT